MDVSITTPPKREKYLFRVLIINIWDNVVTIYNPSGVYVDARNAMSPFILLPLINGVPYEISIISVLLFKE